MPLFIILRKSEVPATRLWGINDYKHFIVAVANNEEFRVLYDEWEALNHLLNTEFVLWHLVLFYFSAIEDLERRLSGIWMRHNSGDTRATCHRLLETYFSVAWFTHYFWVYDDDDESFIFVQRRLGKDPAPPVRTQLEITKPSLVTRLRNSRWPGFNLMKKLLKDSLTELLIHANLQLAVTPAIFTLALPAEFLPTMPTSKTQVWKLQWAFFSAKKKKPVQQTTTYGNTFNISISYIPLFVGMVHIKIFSLEDFSQSQWL